MMYGNARLPASLFFCVYDIVGSTETKRLLGESGILPHFAGTQRSNPEITGQELNTAAILSS